MEIDEQQSGRKRKRKRSKRAVIAVYEKVEVRSEEEGFVGSWHSGTVTACHRQGSHLQYDVKYDNILLDDRSDYLVDQVLVSLRLDDIACASSSQCLSRCFIRPFPPPFGFRRWNLPYGMCVDLYFRECWWEGVVADHRDGSEKRKIFFPDLGDEMIAHVDRLRISQDWNESTETWQHRGIWLLFELVEKCEQHFYVPVSVKQLWYELREKENFKKLGEWTSSDKALWEELFLEVICDNIKLVANNLFLISGLSHGTQKLLEFVKPVNDAIMHPEADHLTSPASVPEMNCDILHPSSPIAQSTQEMPGLEQLVSPSPKNMSNMNLSIESNISCHKAVYVMPHPKTPPASEHGVSVQYPAPHDEMVPSSNFNRCEGGSNSACKTVDWLPAGPDVVPAAEFCPDAIINYAHSGNRKLTVDVKKHLSYLKWKIEFMRDKISRLRFISPDGKCYHSLRQVCLALCKTDDQMLSPISQDEQRFLKFSSGDSLSSTTEQSAMNLLHDCYPRLEVVASSNSDVLSVEPEYCPQAIEEWSNFRTDNSHRVKVKRSEMTLRAKKHLAALGWVFHSINLKGKRTLSYTSPRGRIYWSLRRACRAAMSENASGANPTAGQHMKVGSHREIAQGLLKRKKLSSEFSEMNFQRFENCCTESSCISRLRKSPEVHIWKLQLKKDNLQGTPSLLQIKASSDAPDSSLQKLKTGMGCKQMMRLGNATKYNRPMHMSRSSKRLQQSVNPNSSDQNPRTILSWLIDNNVVLPREKVYYYGVKDTCPILEGRITRAGIKCKCCGKVHSLSSFEHHTCSKTCRPSWKKHRSPAARIFLKDGKSLLDCQMQLINNKKTRSSPAESVARLKGNWQQMENDVICSICHYGGELVLCDQCPSSYHIGCLGMKDTPDGDWFCPSCCCRICGQNELTRGTKQIADSSILSCAQCDHKYHVECLHNRERDKLLSNPKENWFCGKKCEEVFSALNGLVGEPIPVGLGNLTWTLFKSGHPDCNELNEFEIEACSKLTLALDVMHECFEPVEEARTKRDLVKDVIFSKGSELNRLNFRGFYTVLLEKNDEIITVANVRIHGAKVAEMPLVGTRFHYRRRGMCRILLNMLEKTLTELGVERLVLPAVPAALNTWTGSFGFSKMSDSERLQFLDYIFLEFQGTVLCQKLLMDIPSTESCPSREIQPILCNNVCTRDDNTDLDRSSAVSGVSQTDLIEEGGTVELKPVEIVASNNTIGSQALIHQASTVSQPMNAEGEPCCSKINVEFMAADMIYKEESSVNANKSSAFYKELNGCNDGVLKYYKRRKSVAS